MDIAFEVSAVIPADIETVYAAWLDSEKHSKMTGGVAAISVEIGAAFDAWDGYIQGKTIELEPPHRILQRWRTQEFAADEPDSRLEILFAGEGAGTRVTILHSGLPPHGMQYQQGWIDAYFAPMISYFGQTAM